MTKRELEYRHGTPEEFSEALWLACDQMTITPADAKEAILAYWQDWEEAE